MCLERESRIGGDGTVSCDVQWTIENTGQIQERDHVWLHE